MGRPKKKEMVNEAEKKPEKPRVGRPKKEEIVKEAQKKVHSQSSRFFKVYLSSHSSTKLAIVMLCDEQGKKWPVTVRVCSRQDGRITFTKGWSFFYRKNNLKPQDCCMFEFVTVFGEKLNK